MFSIVVLLATLTARPIELPSAPLRSTKDVRALSVGEMRRGLPVEISGQIVAELYPGGLVIADKTGGYDLEVVPEPRPKVGDFVIARGKTFIDEDNLQGSIRFCAITAAGRGPTPVPCATDAAGIAAGRENFNLVRVCGFVSEAVQDENHSEWSWMVLRDNAGNSAYVSVPNAGDTNLVLATLVDAEVEITGVGLPHYAAERMFIGPHLETWSRDCIRVKSPSLSDPFSAPYLSDIYHVGPQELAKMRRRRVTGQVLAAWGGSRFLLREDNGRMIEVDLTDGQELPAATENVDVVGFPGTDLFRINLSKALCRTSSQPSCAGGRLAAPDAVTVKDILTAKNGSRRLQQSFHGKAIRLRGIIRNLPSPGNDDGKMNLDSDGYLVQIDLSANPSAADGLSIGCEIEAAGVCVMETEKWSPTNPFPVFGGFTLVLRTPADIRVLSRPSWWTPTRLLNVIVSLFAALVAIFIWNRFLNRLVERRGRQLFKEQVAHAGTSLKIGERTRLAVELHDSLSQNLAGLACQIAAAKSAVALSPRETTRYLNTAEQMLLSSRTELRRCLWDLRGDTLEMADMTEAVTKTVKPVVGTAELSVRFNVPRTRLMDSTAHSILCIVRELASNAVRHGHASQIRIVGEFHDNTISFSVRDNGCGFDIDNHLGLAEGHFGLTGIRERVDRLDGTFEINSSDTGTKARVTLSVPHATETTCK